MANIATVVVAKAATAVPTPTGAAYASTHILLTDSAGAAQTASVNGSESPPWTAVFTGVAAGAGTVVVTDLDVNAATLGTPISQAFTEAGSAPATYLPSVSVTVASS